jgi:hypothetical protein
MTCCQELLDTGNFLRFFFLFYVIQHCFIYRPSDSSVSEDAGIEPRDAEIGPRDAEIGPRDAGIEPKDAGIEPRDVRIGPRDAGIETRDAGIEPKQIFRIQTFCSTLDNLFSGGFIPNPSLKSIRNFVFVFL